MSVDQTPWTAISLGLFGLVQVCFGAAVAAGWHPWEQHSPQDIPTVSVDGAAPMPTLPSRSSSKSDDFEHLKIENGKLAKTITLQQAQIEQLRIDKTVTVADNRLYHPGSSDLTSKITESDRTIDSLQSQIAGLKSSRSQKSSGALFVDGHIKGYELGFGFSRCRDALSKIANILDFQSMSSDEMGISGSSGQVSYQLQCGKINKVAIVSAASNDSKLLGAAANRVSALVDSLIDPITN